MADKKGVHILRRIWREHTRRYIWHIIGAMALTALVASAEAYSVSLLRPIFDTGLDGRSMRLLYFLCAQVAVIYLAKGLLYYFQSNLMSYVSAKTIQAIRQRVFDHMLTLDLKFFNNTSSGHLLNRIVQETGSIANIAINFIQSVFKDGVTCIAMVALMIWQSWQLFLIVLAFAPIGAFLIRRLSSMSKSASSQNLAANSKFMSKISESLQNIKIVKSYGMERFEMRSVAETFDQMFGIVMRMNRIMSATSPIMEGLSGMILAGIILLGGWQVSSGALSTGGFVAFLGAWVAAYKPLKNLIGFRVQLQMALVAARSIYELIDTKPEITDAPGARGMPKIKKGIEFRDVGFEYEKGKPVLLGLNMKVPAGKTVALVGHSGGGKSTIVNLMSRFFDVLGGAITIDGVDIRKIKLSSLHDNIALVSQEVLLFDASVRDNIAYGKGYRESGEVSLAEVKRAARLANADKFIAKMSNGYDTMIGERGVKLSGGQKQRISIARALVKDSPILLLDEATSALDTESEHEVQAALDTLMKGRTTIVIAHRLSTIVGADKIYVIDRGGVVEEGTHAGLLAKGGEYAKLYKMQFKDKKGGGK